MRRRERITIGQSPKNTFYVPISQLPHQLPLFEVKNGQYLLVLNENLRGRISYDGQVHALESLSEHPNIITKGDKKYLPLTDKNRGKVVLGNIAVQCKHKLVLSHVHRTLPWEIPVVVVLF